MEPAHGPLAGLGSPVTDRHNARTAGAVVVASVVAGHWLAVVTAPLVHDRMFPWIMGRGLGIAAYLVLTALVTAGLWFRHPWANHRAPGRAARLRFHAVLAAATVALVAGHVTALALDRYAGVGWAGVFVAGHATYRPAAVTLGTLALYGIVLITATAALAGVVGRHAWYPVHQVSLGVFGLTAWHGITAGSDTSSLRLVYAATIGLVAVVAATRALAGRSRPMPEPVHGTPADPARVGTPRRRTPAVVPSATVTSDRPPAPGPPGTPAPRPVPGTTYPVPSLDSVQVPHGHWPARQDVVR